MTVKFLIGGSPCTHWSIAQKNNRETEADGLGWELFRNYLIAKEKFKPDFFLYENNKSAAKPIKDQIAKELGVELQYINSALVSAQNRQRFYAHNIPNVPQPEDRGILLRDILEGSTGEQHYELSEAACVAQRGRYTGINGKVRQNFEVRSDGKTNTLTTVQKDNLVTETVRIGTIGSNSQAHRVYSPDGKSVNLVANGGGQGAKTGLYATPLEVDDEYFKGGFSDEQKPNLIGKIVCDNTSRNGNQPAQVTRIYSPNGKAVCLDSDSRKYIIDNADGKQQPVYEVLNGLITIKDKQYPIKLADGFYIIRKLTITECCRLQTMPDDYCRVVSNAQAYKGLGNGWTAEVIMHILRHANVPLDEEIIVLSMYDGIGTGRYCFDKLGYKNVKYYAYEIDKYAMQVSQSNYPDIIQCGDAFAVREGLAI